MSRLGVSVTVSTAVTPYRYAVSTNDITVHHNKFQHQSFSAAVMNRKGHSAYYTHYERQYTAQWNNSLLPALLRTNRYVALVNQYCTTEQQTQVYTILQQQFGNTLIQSSTVDIFHHKQLLQCYLIASNNQQNDRYTRFPEPHSILQNNATLPYYPLDLASLICVDVLFAHTDLTSMSIKVLDVCSAPGGKALAISQLLQRQLRDNQYNNVVLQLNELSTARRQRLQSVVKQYITGSNLCSVDKIKYTSLDATHHTFSRDSYTHILVDAPCSSSRHVLQNNEELSKWSSKLIQMNAKRQLGILLTAFKSLQIGGRLLYSTCSIDEAENDGVILQFLQRTSEQYNVSVLTGTDALHDNRSHINTKIGTMTRFGVMILPDQVSDIDTVHCNISTGFGPIFLCLLQRNELITESDT